MLLTSREIQSIRPTNNDLDKYLQLRWVGLICSCLPSARETGSTSLGLRFPSCVSLLRVGGTQMNTYSVSMTPPPLPPSPPLVARALVIVIDNEESVRLGLPSFSLTLDSSVLVAHTDAAPHTGGPIASRLQQNRLEKPRQKEKTNVLSTTVCTNESVRQSATEQRRGPPASFLIF